MECGEGGRKVDYRRATSEVVVDVYVEFVMKPLKMRCSW